jgi:Cytochrome c3
VSGLDRLRRSFFVCVGPLAFAAAAHAQVSPGPLASAHRELDTPLQCFQCHPKAGASGGAMDLRCLACHTEVAWMKERHRGFHARVTQPCAKCHPDHGGRDFKLVAWDEGTPEKFDHQRTGWALEGKHAALACRSCHKPEFQHSEATAKIRAHDHAQSWLGLETACASCHTDPHRGQLGAECQKCHVAAAWKPAPGFDHAKTAYPLTGKHAGLMCANCHEAPQLALAHDAKGVAIPQYKPLPHADCVSCHRDPHAGRFGKTCMSCHTTDSFQNIRKAGFNHDQTRYPLRGKHAALECATCHDEKTAWGKKPPFAACGSCHREMHAGLATLAGKPADCSACHDVNGFHPSTFPLAQHQLSKYPLEGRHATILCNTCHAKLPATDAATAALGDARVAMRPEHDACIACHNDPHQGRFSGGGEHARARGCLACHGMNTFHPSLVDDAMHATFAFKLEGAHRAVPCQACHAELNAAPAASSLRSAHGNARALRFAESAVRCASCHQSPHGDQFAARKDHGACESCHDQDSFQPASHFDHVHGASFVLDGAHQRVACAACHRSEKTSVGHTRVIYRPVASRCVDCHSAGDPAHAPAPH